ncbi:hypothetical protein [Arthrobacter glacialis]|uniref:hypothetical protein n=1 Tax=Arthrobacter glacialis TaxID=1664 RepID=UPI001A9C4D26|nr:hypothetical protein [Arthrobacter glacialis]
MVQDDVIEQGSVYSFCAVEDGQDGCFADEAEEAADTAGRAVVQVLALGRERMRYVFVEAQAVFEGRDE